MELPGLTNVALQLKQHFIVMPGDADSYYEIGYYAESNILLVIY